jgi:hypothetical protein
MKRRYAKRVLAVLHGQPFTATAEMRDLVKLLVFNGTPEARMATGLGLSIEELRYHFADELGYSQDRLLAESAARVIALMRQDKDPAIALNAAKMMLQTRLKAWRVPETEAQEGKPVEAMTLIEVDRAIADLERRRRDAAAFADPETAAPDQQGKPH